MPFQSLLMKHMPFAPAIYYPRFVNQLLALATFAADVNDHQ
jgi:hypothetical protein